MKRTPERQRAIIEHNEKCGFFDKPESEHFDNEDIPSNFGMCIYVVAFIILLLSIGCSTIPEDPDIGDGQRTTIVTPVHFKGPAPDKK